MAFITASGVPAGPVGQGTWRLGDSREVRAREISALRAGIEAGMSLIDTAEMYGEGLAEELTGEAIRGYDRERLYIVSKVYPFNAGRDNIFKSCEGSLRRLGTDYLDLYLLHWRGRIPFEETVECMEELRRRGLIRRWGVSNLDVPDMERLMRAPGGEACLTDQVLYNLGSRGIEFDLLPWLRERGMEVMAYCPLAQMGRLDDRLKKSAALEEISARRSASPAQIMLAFLLTRPGVTPIPCSSRPEHAQSNALSAKIRLTPEDLSALNSAFPAPTRKLPLEIV